MFTRNRQILLLFVSVAESFEVKTQGGMAPITVSLSRHLTGIMSLSLLLDTFHDLCASIYSLLGLFGIVPEPLGNSDFGYAPPSPPDLYETIADNSRRSKNAAFVVCFLTLPSTLMMVLK